jgi:tetratricopeptide (TPR) repeat protein
MGAGELTTLEDELVLLTTRGRTRLEIGGEEVPLRPRERGVLAAIALSHPRSVTVDEIVLRVWGDAAPANARKSLHNHISRIRQSIPGLVATGDDGYVLARPTEVDHASGNASDTPLGDLADIEEVRHLRAEVDDVTDHDLERHVRRRLHDPDPQLLSLTQQLLERHPDRESLWHLHAELQALLGQRRQALASLRTARMRLREYGLDLSSELEALERSLLLGRPSSVAAQPTIEPPARIHPHRDDPFVGRVGELDDLARCWKQVLQARSPHLAVVRGPAGMGKTRLVDEFVQAVSASLDELPRIALSRERRNDDRPLGSIGDLLPLLAPEQAVTSMSDDERAVDARQRFHEVVRGLASTPTIWCIDDLQWMPTDSLDLLSGALEVVDGPLLLVATYRTGELDDPQVVDRRVATTIIDLDAMGIGELRELVEAWALPIDLDTDLELLRARTAGLPLFATEVARSAIRRGERIDPSSVPAALRDWVRIRFEELGEIDPAMTNVIQFAALVGVEFDVDVLAASADLDVDTTDRLLDELVERGVLGSGRRPGELQFSHALLRDVVVEMIGPARARRRHQRVAAAIAERPRTDRIAEWHSALAHHLSLGGAEATEVRRHAVAACDLQLADGAWSAASRSIELALGTGPDRSERAALLARHGRVLLRVQRFADAAASLRDAIEIAAPLGLREVQGRATLDLVGRAGRGAATDSTDAERISLVRSALDALGDESDDTTELTVLRSELERELALALLLTGAATERNDLLERSVARVEELEPVPVDALASAILGRRYARLDPTALDQRIDDLDRVLQLDPRHVRRESLVLAHLYRAEEELRRGRADACRRFLDGAQIALDSYPDPYLTWAASGWRVLLSLHDGDLDAAEQLASATLQLGRGSSGSVAGFGVNLTNIRLLQRRAGEVIPVLNSAVEQHPEIPAYRAVLALCASESGETDLARASIDVFQQAGYENLSYDTSRSLALITLSHAAADIGHADAARSLLPLVSPQAGQHAVISAYGSGGAYWGPVSYALARLALTSGDRATAAAWFEDAVREVGNAPLFAERIARHAAELG